MVSRKRTFLGTGFSQISCLGIFNMPGGYKLCREMGGSWNLPFHTGAGIYFEPEKKLSGNPTFHYHFIFLLEFIFHSAWYLPVQQSDSANPNPIVRFWKKDFKFQIYWGLWICCMSSYCFIWLNIFKDACLHQKIEVCEWFSYSTIV